MRRWWLVLGLFGLAVVVLIPLAWWATRPAASAGAPVDAPITSTARSQAAQSTPGTGNSFSTSSATSTQPTRAAVNVRVGRARLAVPSLGINAPLVAVGVRPDGSMAIPDPVQDVGWYEFGPAPGAGAGSAVLAGHVDNAKQGRGALFNLRDVGVGARISVTLASGTTLDYRVTGRELFEKRRLPTERLFTQDGAPRLVIITCGGPFIPSLSSYRDNLVVAADPVQ